MCEHQDIEVVGSPDPYGKRVRGGVRTKFDMDARCNDCGESLKVDYEFAGVSL